MSLAKDQVLHIARELLEAERTLSPIAEISKRYDGMSIDDAYAIQVAHIGLQTAAGAKIVGRKIGLTSKAMQALIGIDEPNFGTIIDSKVFREGEPIPVGMMRVPRIEAEIGFVLAEDLEGPGINVIDVLAATAGVMPLLEVKDTRLATLKPTIEDSIADNATSGIVILGGKLTPLAADIDLRLVGMVFEHNGVVASTATGAEALGNPAQPVAWLANKLHQFGLKLRRGEFIMSGGLTRALEVKPGDHFRANFDRLGSVSALFK
jgi:2-keto-4-pentenoate hydratase